ncbi:MAG: helix-turn-helix transcriptional regulator [Selenomonadaceae bacterium]|nr:helix-turn-helix transcriptional regulator [Selenomonadaceae bacterium]
MEGWRETTETTLGKFCKQNKISSTKLAERLGVSVSMVRKIRYGEYQPSYNFLKKLKQEFPMCDMNIFF